MANRSKGKNLIPQLRFPEFTGEWEQRKLGEFGSVMMNRRVYREQTSESGDVPFYKIGTFGGKADAYISRELFEEYKKKYPYPKVGDILISASGSIGRIVEYQGKDEYFQDSNIVWLDHDEKLDNLFLKQFYSLVKWEGLEGSTIKRLYNENILSTAITLPSREEQTVIGQFLSKVDSFIVLHQERVEHLETLRRGLLFRMFPMAGERIPRIRFPGFVNEWKKQKIQDLVEIHSGCDYRHLSPGSIPVYGTGGYMLSVDKALSDHEDAVGIGRKGTIDRPYILRAPFWTVDTLFYAVPKSGMNLEFTLCLFLRVNWKKRDESTGVPSLSKQTINSVEVLIPDLEEQRQIGLFFQKLDDCIALHENKIDHLNKLKRGLLRQMLI